jgi:hypothetical protein
MNHEESCFANTSAGDLDLSLKSTLLSVVKTKRGTLFYICVCDIIEIAVELDLFIRLCEYLLNTLATEHCNA